MAKYKIYGKEEKLRGIYYELDASERPLGEGGMGKVFRGKCIDEKAKTSKDVAIKFMYSDLPPYAIEKAKREANIHFTHQNLIEMLGFIDQVSTDELGMPTHHYHVVSELLIGVPLDKLLAGYVTDQYGNKVDFAEELYNLYKSHPDKFAIRIVKSVLNGLITMHANGYIHRDIDPSNIMVTSDRRIKLIDFGIAKKVNTMTSHDKQLTQAGQFVGKAKYAAPELVVGAINEQDGRTDLYAVGIMLFELITGHTPFNGDRSEILQAQLHKHLPLRQVKYGALRQIIDKATKKARKERFDSAASFLSAIGQAEKGIKANYQWRTSYSFIVGGIAVCAVIAIVVLLRRPVPTPQKITYDEVITQMHKGGEEGKEALNMLKYLSDTGDSRATTLRALMMFQSNAERDREACPDSILTFREELDVQINNVAAHMLLKKAIEQDSTNYHALYEYACDFFGASARTDAVKERDEVQAEKYYRQALEYAEEANDAKYVGMIKDYLNKLEQLKEM
ncbi:MAG: serine/threonine protein kinase [Prevotellaceae bacterium]|nr:serine/threonine protein kinase [Prevotellaceae bacterium]